MRPSSSATDPMIITSTSSESYGCSVAVTPEVALFLKAFCRIDYEPARKRFEMDYDIDYVTELLTEADLAFTVRDIRPQ